MLDHGCGEALHADKIAAHCAELLLCEAAPNVRTRVAERFKSEPKIRALSPDEVEKLPANSLDLVVANSLLQYLKRDELDAMLLELEAHPEARRESSSSPIFFRINRACRRTRSRFSSFATKNGFLIAAFAGLVRTVFSDYGKIRAQLGVAQYSEDEMLGILQAAEFTAKRLAKNFGHNQQRMAFEGIKPS